MVSTFRHLLENGPRVWHVPRLKLEVGNEGGCFARAKFCSHDCFRSMCWAQFFLTTASDVATCAVHSSTLLGRFLGGKFLPKIRPGLFWVCSSGGVFFWQVSGFFFLTNPDPQNYLFHCSQKHQIFSFGASCFALIGLTQFHMAFEPKFSNLIIFVLTWVFSNFKGKISPPLSALRHQGAREGGGRGLF